MSITPATEDVAQRVARDFPKDVSTHTLTVKHDDGLYRHLVCRAPDTSNQWFEIITWPGSLTIGGDMGTYSFSRCDDMFSFFGKEGINPGYWTEKVTASDSRHGGSVTEYTADRFRVVVLEQIEDLHADELTHREYLDVVEDLKREVFSLAEDELSAREALDDFTHEGDKLFTETWELDFTEYSYRYLWCLHAITWAIRHYRGQSAVPVPSAPVEVAQARRVETVTVGSGVL